MDNEERVRLNEEGKIKTDGRTKKIITRSKQETKT
jgi:non-ribosomal peptide synthetase component E (peptide arylation enzyme)